MHTESRCPYEKRTARVAGSFFNTSTSVLPSLAGEGETLMPAFSISERPIAFDRHPAPRARLRVIVPECLVLDAAVVPEGDRMGLPGEPHLEFLPRAVLAQKLEDRAAFFSRQPIDVG